MKQCRLEIRPCKQATWCLSYCRNTVSMKYKLRLYFFLFLFKGIAITSFSQQGNVWYFGDNAGLNFNTNPPSSLTDGRLTTYEGCSGISDNNGRILFYTDGITVWNKQHQVMV